MTAPVATASVEITLSDRITTPLRRVAASLSNLSRRLGLDRIGRAAVELTGRLRGLGDGLARTTGRLSSFIALAGAGSAGAIMGMFNLAKGASEVGSEIGEAAQKLGIGVVALQEYRYAAKMSGIESATLGKGIEKLGINAVEARKGNKGLIKDFRALGVTLKGSNGQMRTTEQLFGDTLNKLAKVKDPLQRNRLAFKLFGKSGVELMKMLGDGAEGLARKREEARRSGAIFGENAINAADKFGDNLDALMERLTGFQRLLGVQLLPVLNEMVEGVTAWFDANAGLVRSTIVEWVQSFSKVMRDLMNPTSELRLEIAKVATNFRSFLDAIRPVIDFLGGPLQASIIAAAAWIAGPLVTATALLTAAFVRLAAAFLLTPFGWIVAGVAAVGSGVYVLYQKWDEFAAYWSGLWGRITSAFDRSFMEGIGTALDEFNPLVHIVRGLSAVLEYFTGFSLTDAGTKMMDTLYAGVAAGGERVFAWVADLMQKFQDFGTSLGDKFFALGSAVIDRFLSGLKDAWAGVVDWFKGAVDGLVGWLPESIRSRLGFSAEAPAGDGGTTDGETGTAAKTAPDVPTFEYPAPVMDPLGMPIPVDVNVPEFKAPEPIKLDTGGAGKSISDSITDGLRSAWADLMRPVGDLAPRPPTVSAPGKAVADSTRIDLAAPRVEAPTPIVLPPVNATPQTVQTQEVDAGSVKVGTATFPEPLLTHQPQTVNAPLNVGGITVNVQGMTPAEAQGMFQRALSGVAQQHAANIQSSLSD